MRSRASSQLHGMKKNPTTFFAWNECICPWLHCSKEKRKTRKGKDGGVPYWTVETPVTENGLMGRWCWRGEVNKRAYKDGFYLLTSGEKRVMESVWWFWWTWMWLCRSWETKSFRMSSHQPSPRFVGHLCAIHYSSTFVPPKQLNYCPILCN